MLDTSLAQRPCPLWIKIGFIFCCILLMKSLFNLSHYCELNNKIKKAKKAFDNEKYGKAMSYYRELATELPGNRHIKLYLIECLLRSPYVDDHETAFYYISTIKDLKKREWQKILDYIPSQYLEHLQEETKEEEKQNEEENKDDNTGYFQIKNIPDLQEDEDDHITG